MSVANDQLDGAVRNNAEWCKLACRTHGSPGPFADGMWINRGRIPRFYLSAQTITRDGHRQLKLIKVLTRESIRAGWALKGSFASLDLRSLGFTVLFEAQWIILSPKKLSTAVSAEPR